MGKKKGEEAGTELNSQNAVPGSILFIFPSPHVVPVFPTNPLLQLRVIIVIMF